MALADSQPAGVAITNAFGYNVRSEVTSALMGTNAYGYVFDPIGNRIVATNNAEVTSYAANELNQYTNILCASAPQREPSHDLDGNMLTNGVWSYTWDGENRLIGVSSNDVLVASYTYDHQSRRVGKVSHEDAKTRSYVYDGWNLIQELTHSQTHALTNFYTWGLDLSGTLQGAGGVGGLLAAVQGGELYYPAFDANGNVTGYVYTDGMIAANYEYDAFGCTIAQSGNLADTFAFRFSTKVWEDQSKLYYYGYRFYSSELGRWGNRDPKEERGGVALYLMVDNALLNKWDYIGEAPQWIWHGSELTLDENGNLSITPSPDVDYGDIDRPNPPPSGGTPFFDDVDLGPIGVGPFIPPCCSSSGCIQWIEKRRDDRVKNGGGLCYLAAMGVCAVTSGGYFACVAAVGTKCSAIVAAEAWAIYGVELPICLLCELP